LIFFLAFLAGIVGDGFAGSDSLRQSQVSVRLVNDAFIKGRMDRYYSSGIKVDFYQYLSQGKSWSITMGKEMYTPDLKKDRSLVPFQRPFAGMIFLEPGMQWRKKRWFYEISALGGLMGPQSGIGKLHCWYHELVGFPKPAGWEEQLSDAVLGNIYAGAKVHLLGNSLADITLAGKAGFGNWDKSIQLGSIFRLGNLLPLPNSQLSGSRVGSNGKSVEQYFQLGFFRRQSFWNGSVQGGDFKKDSGFSASRNGWVCSGDLVLNFQHVGFSYGLTFQSKDTLNAKNHFFGKIAFHWLF
jgi:hypothetical protein